MQSQNLNLSWFDEWKKSLNHERLLDRPIAYFCAEFALENIIPTYSGGLGVLAGDVVREAADRGVPLVGVGLYYRHGYICATKIVGGKEVEACTDMPPEGLGLTAALGPSGDVLKIKVPIQDRYVEVMAWKWVRNGVAVYLMDSDLDGNSPADRRITERLYVNDKEMRMKQEIVLGIGGLRLLEALNIHPTVYHLNEGHSALLGLELIHHEMKERQMGFDEAKQFARRRIVLTNHTLVPAGNEVFSDDLVALLLGKFAEDMSVPVNDMVKLGLVQESSVFSMTTLALRLSGVVNAVSKLHAVKAKDIWRDHPMAAITNGIHLPTWDRLGYAGGTEGNGAIWKLHQEKKDDLLEFIKEKSGRDWSRDHLLIGWARRFAAYKRPLALFEDVKRFEALARNAERPIRVVFAGRPHPNDAEGQRLLKELCALVEGELKDVSVYLPDYNLDMAGLLTAGCDLWLNTPVVGFEACGTSGMKAALNGVLPCSTRDGWMHEVEIADMGWMLDSGRVSSHVLEILEREIVPAYYGGSGTTTTRWLDLMKRSRQTIIDHFSATRMVKEYLETLYL